MSTRALNVTVYKNAMASESCTNCHLLRLKLFIAHVPNGGKTFTPMGLYSTNHLRLDKLLNNVGMKRKATEWQQHQ